MTKFKYEPKHEWVKALKLDSATSQFLDSLTDHFGKLIDNTSMRDWVYVLSYLAAVHLAYITLKRIKMTFPTWLSMVLPPLALINLLKGFNVVPEITTEELDWETMGQAMVAGYMVLKIDMADVASATAKLGSVLSELVG